MGMLPVPRHWTIDDYAAFPEDGNRYEIIDRALFVTPLPNGPHQGVHRELFLRLGNYLKANPIGRVFSSPADIVLARDTVMQPDLFVLPLGLQIAEWEDIRGRLLLAIEILSPSTAGRDRTIKRERYLRAAIPEYWTVDPRRRNVEIWRRGTTESQVADDVLRWAPDAARPPLEIDLPTLFSEGLEGFI